MRVRVGTFGNNCGLFSLALGVSLAMRATGKTPAVIPEFVRGIIPRDVQNTGSFSSEGMYSPRQIEIAQLMRRELANAMLANADYKQLRIKNFIPLCVDKYTPIDMEAFSNSNHYIIYAIRSKLDQIVPEDANFRLPADRFIPAPAIRAEQITGLKDSLIQLMRSDFTRVEFNQLLNHFHPANEIATLLFTCTLFNSAWNQVRDIDGSEQARKRVKEYAEDWFFNQCRTLFSNVQLDSELNRLLIELGRCRIHMGGTADINYNARSIYAYLLVSQQWEQIFQNYAEYVRTRHVMLSVDELNVLATAWSVDLAISDNGNRRTYAALNVNFTPALEVAITNDSGIHWDVLADDSLDLRGLIAEDVPVAPSTTPSTSRNNGSTTNPYLLLSGGKRSVNTFFSKPSTLRATTRIAPALHTPLTGLSSTAIAVLRQQLEGIRDQKLNELQSRKTLLKQQLAENDQALASKVESVDTRMKKQQAALETELKLSQEEEQLKNAIVALENLIKENHGEGKVADRVNQEIKASLNENLDDFLSGKVLDNLHEEAEKEANNDKALLGKSDTEIRLEREQRNEDKWRKAIQGFEDQNKLLNDKLNNEKQIVEDAQSKMTDYAQKIKQQESTLAAKRSEKSQIEGNLSTAKKKLTDAASQLDRDLSSKGTIKITVASCAGPHDMPNRGYIMVNNNKLHPHTGVWRGLHVAFIDSTNGNVVFSGFYDTHASADQMEAAAAALDTHRNNQALIVVITSVDESTEGGGFRRKVRDEPVYANWNIFGIHRWLIRVDHVPYVDFNATTPQHTHLLNTLDAMGSRQYRTLRWRNLWHFVKGPGIEGGPKESSMVCAEGENSLTRSYSYASETPREHIIAAYENRKKVLEADRKRITAQLEEAEKAILGIENSIQKHRIALATETERKGNAEKQVASLTTSIANNETSLQPLRVRLSQCLAEQEKLKKKLQDVAAGKLSKDKKTPESKSEINPEEITRLQSALKEKRDQLKTIQEGLVQAKAKVNQLVCPQGDLSAVPLITAVLNQSIPMMEAILQLTDQVNITDEYGWTALHCAVARACIGKEEVAIKMIQMLLQAGARLDLANSEERLPHEVAVTAKMRQLLLNTALNTYARKGDYKQCEWALLHGADANTQVAIAEDPVNRDGQNRYVAEQRSPLSWAVVSVNSDPRIIELLLSYKADPRLKNKHGWDAVMQAELMQSRRSDYSPMIHKLLLGQSVSASSNASQDGKDQPEIQTGASPKI